MMTVEERALKHFGTAKQTWKTVEEFGEFLQALSKFENDNSIENYDSVCEELADAQIMIDQMKLVFHHWHHHHSFKLRRLSGIINQ